jgi:hypothetical protein
LAFKSTTTLLKVEKIDNYRAALFPSKPDDHTLLHFSDIWLLRRPSLLSGDITTATDRITRQRRNFDPVSVAAKIGLEPRLQPA